MGGELTACRQTEEREQEREREREREREKRGTARFPKGILRGQNMLLNDLCIIKMNDTSQTNSPSNPSSHTHTHTHTLCIHATVLCSLWSDS